MVKNTVYVLGAGFSKEAGFPLSTDFTEDKEFDYLKEKLEDEPKLISKLEKIRSYVRYRIHNNFCSPSIESILNHVTTAQYLFMESITEKRKPYSAEKILDNLLWYITKNLKEKTLDNNGKMLKEYEIFLKKICKKDDTIITFNYDLVIENVLKLLKKEYHYGVDESNSKNSRLILKLHGSLNWIYCKKCGPVNRHDQLITFESEPGEICPLCKSDKIRPILVPPMMAKDKHYNDKYFGPIVRETWALAREMLSEATRIIFIGFSMADEDHFAQGLFKLSQGMNTNKNIKFIVINPSSDINLKSRYEKVIVNTKPYFKKTTFTNFVRNYAKFQNELKL